MWPWLVSAGLALGLGGILVWSWWPRTSAATKAAIDGAGKVNQAQAETINRLEAAQEKEWSQNHAQDEDDARRATDRAAALEFLRDSFRSPGARSSGKAAVQGADVARAP